MSTFVYHLEHPTTVMESLNLTAFSVFVKDGFVLLTTFMAQITPQITVRTYLILMNGVTVMK